MKSIEKLLTVPLTVIDVGASGGIDSRWKQLKIQYNAILFEPDPREFDSLNKNKKKGTHVLNTALSEKKGELDLYLCRKQEVSSIHKPNFALLSLFPESKRYEILKTIRIAVDTIDNQAIQNGINPIDFIKIDAQGHGYSILKGCEKTLQNAVGVETEIEFIEIYENQPLFSQINTFLTDHGFELFDLKRYFWNRKSTKAYGADQKGQLTMGDALYFKTPEKILTNRDVNVDVVTRAFLVYSAYGYFDLAEIMIEKAFKQQVITTTEYNQLSAVLLTHEQKLTLPSIMTRILIKLAGLIDRFQNTFSPPSGFNSDQKLGN